MHCGHVAQPRSQFGTEDGGIRQTSGHQRYQRVAHRPGLLEDFLLHEVPIGAPLHRLSPEFAHHHRSFHSFTVGAGQFHAMRTDHGQVAVSEKAVAPRYRKQCGNIRRNVILRLAQSHHHRGAAVRRNNGIRFCGRQNDHGVTAPQSGKRVPGCYFEILAGAQSGCDEMGDAFRIRIAGEGHAGGGELILDGLVVFHDAVVHNRHLVAGKQRMGIAFVGGAVRCPAGVGNAQCAVHRFLLKIFGQPGHEAGPAKPPQTAVSRQQRHAGGVVAAVFQPPQTFQQQGPNIALRCDSNDSAHASNPPA